MKSRIIFVVVIIAMLASIVFAQAQRKHLNPMVDLLAEKKPVFGISPPSVPAPQNAQPGGGGGGRGEAAAQPATNPGPDMCGVVPPPPAPRGEGRGGRGPGGGGNAARGGGGGRGPAANALPQPQTLAEAAKMALAYGGADYLFNGSFEGGVTDARINSFTEFMNALKDAGNLSKAGVPHLTHPFALKTPSIAEIPDGYIQALSKQLNTGATTLMFPDVDCAKELSAGLAAMRFRSKGGTRPDAVGVAPAIWGMTEAQYKQKADVWPLNPDGELVNWTIIETKEGLKNVRQIAAVKGIGVLWPGAGTLGGVFSTTQPDGTRKRDDVAWENAIQSVLAACKEFNIACGYPVGTPADVEMRMKQGFSVFVAQSWSQGSFDTIAAGRKLAGRPEKNQ
jgi:4-hydroxy-2-oxoheptanedioate aldolase